MKKVQNWLSLVLCAAMVMGLLPGLLPEAKAETYDLWVGGTRVTSENCNDIPAKAGYTEYSGKASYDDSTKTLTLDGYNYKGPGGAGGGSSDQQGYSIYGGSFDPLTIVLKGINNLTTTAVDGNWQSHGMGCGNGELIIQGDGTLNVTTTDNSSTSVGISGIKLTIKSGTVNAKGGKSTRSYGIRIIYGTVSIQGGKLTAVGDDATESYGVECGKIIIGNNAESVEASGRTEAVDGKVLNAIKGIGWTDYDGTTGKTAIGTSDSGQDLSSYKKVCFTLASLYTVTGTEGTEHTVGSGEDAVYTVKRNENDAGETFNSFTGAVVDGKAIPDGGSTAESGSLILTLKSKYLDTLSVGNHTVTISFTDGTVEAPLKIKAAKPHPVPKTGDNNHPVLWIGFLLLGIAGLAVPGVMKASLKRK